jgi:hypothetical protein
MKSEPRGWYERRNALQRQKYPELDLATPKMVSQVDALRVNRGQLPSQLTLDTTSLARQLTPQSPPQPPAEPPPQGGNWLSAAVSGAGGALSGAASAAVSGAGAAVSGAGGALSGAASAAGSAFKRGVEVSGESQYQRDVAAPMAQAEAIRNSGMYLNRDAWREYGTDIGDYVKSSWGEWGLSDENKAKLVGTQYEAGPAQRGSISPRAVVDTISTAATPPIIAGNPIIETATNPSTYAFGPSLGGKLVAGAALGSGAEKGVEALGGSEGQQSAAGTVGHIAPFYRDIFGVAKLGARGVGALKRGVSNTISGGPTPRTGVVNFHQEQARVAREASRLIDEGDGLLNRLGIPLSSPRRTFTDHEKALIAAVKRGDDLALRKSLGAGGLDGSVKTNLEYQERLVGMIKSERADAAAAAAAAKLSKPPQGQSAAMETAASGPNFTPIQGAKTLAEAQQAALAPVRQSRLYNIPSPSEFLAGIKGAPTAKKVQRAERVAARKASGLAQTENANAAPLFQALGRQKRGRNKNVEMRDIKPSQWEIDHGYKNALMVRVLEKPTEYALTAKQSDAVKQIARIPEVFKVERELHGVPPELVPVPDKQNFIWRVVKKGSEGTGQRKGKTGTPPSSGIGFKHDDRRQYLDIDDALKDRVVYVNPENAFNERVKESLAIIREARMEPLYATIANKTTSAQRVSAVTKAKSKEIVGELDALAAKYPGTRLAPEETIAEIVKSNRRVGIEDLDGLISKLNKAATEARTSPDWIRAPEALVKAREEDIASLVASLTAKKDSFRRAINSAAATPKGMQEIASDVAPGLKDLEFTKRAANKIEDHYRGLLRLRIPGTDIGRAFPADIPLVKGTSKVLTPIRATGDFSAVLINNGIVAARNPLTFIENVARATKDMVDEPGYNRWLTSKEVAMAVDKGVAITGRAGEAAEFQLANWMVHIPLPGGRRMATPIFKGLNDHYNMLNNRQRVSLFNQRVRMMERGGEPVSRETQEGIARAYNRLTGIPDARATDIEQIAAFAPNFMRAHLETLAHAVQFGTVESRIAKEYLATAAAVGTSAVTALALKQGRPLDEVLQPFDLNALRRGEIRPNPNFMSMRLFGQDIKIYGKFDSIMRLAAITSDAGLQAIVNESPKEMWSALTYYLGSQGSPLVSWFTAVQQGETFSGNEPISIPGIAEQVTPFTVPEVSKGIGEGLQAIREGFTGEGEFSAAIDPLAAAAVTTLGGKASPMTTTERVMAGERDEFTPEEARISIKAASWKSILDSVAAGEDGWKSSHQPGDSDKWFEDRDIVSPEGFRNIWEWRQAQEKAFREALEEYFENKPALLTAEVQRRINATFIMDDYLDHKAQNTTQWIRANPAEAWDAWQTEAKYGDKGYWNPREGDEEIMLNWWEGQQKESALLTR